MCNAMEKKIIILLFYVVKYGQTSFITHNLQGEGHFCIASATQVCCIRPPASISCSAPCDPPCVKGRCHGPGLCKCLTNYVNEEESNHICSLPCKAPCQNGATCRNGHCVCKKGYELTGGSCTPVCAYICRNSICVEPENCKCSPGYEKSSNDTYQCDPVCKLECINGKCSAPNNCSCNDGYENNKQEMQWNVCVPKCDFKCINGYCAAPNTCICKTGYKKSSNSSCEPVCSTGCENGKCVGPNFCQCNPGTIKLKHDVCRPHCSNITQFDCAESYSHTFANSITALKYHEFLFHWEKPFFIRDVDCSRIIKTINSPYECYTELDRHSHVLKAFCLPQNTPQLPVNISTSNVTSGHHGFTFTLFFIVESMTNLSRIYKSSEGCNICFEQNLIKFPLKNYTTIYLKKCPVAKATGSSLWLWLAAAFFLTSVLAAMLYSHHRHKNIAANENGHGERQQIRYREEARIINNDSLVEPEF